MTKAQLKNLIQTRRELKVYAPYRDSDGTIVRNVEQKLPEVVVTNDLKHKQLRNKNELLIPDTRSRYQQNQSQKAAQQAQENAKVERENAIRELGFENIMKLTSPSTYAEAITGSDFGSVGRFAFDAAVFGGPSLAKNVAKQGLKKLGRSTATQILRNPNNFKFELRQPIPIENPNRLLSSKYVADAPEMHYTGKIPTRLVDYKKVRDFQNARKMIQDIVKSPTDYDFKEILLASQAFEDARLFLGTLPITKQSSGNVIEHGGLSFREHLKKNINPVLRHDGFKGVPLDASPEEAMQYVRNIYRELNTFARGIIDPRDMKLYNLYDRIELELSKKLGRSPSHDEIMDYMAVTPNRGTTRHGDLGRQSGEYVLYTSNGLDQSAGYALRGNSRFGVNPDHRAVYELELPEHIPSEREIDSRFSPIGNYILSNRFALQSRARGEINKDLYSEYGLPYQLATGRALSSDLPPSIDYNASLNRYAAKVGIPVYNPKEASKSFALAAKLTNERADEINSILLTLNTDIRMPYTSYKTAVTHPQAFVRNRTVVNGVKLDVSNYKKALQDWPEYMHDKLNKLFLNDVKRTLKGAKLDNKDYSKRIPFKLALKTPVESEMKAQVESKLGKTPEGGYLKHPYAKNVFTTEGRNRAITVNDKRYITPTGTRDENASLQHYVFFNKSGEPILNIKRRVPFEEWSRIRNAGSSHWGSYHPGYSRRMSQMLVPVIGANYLYNTDDKK